MSNNNQSVDKPCKILIVDDEPYNIRVLKLKFENAGYTVVTASNGLDGLNKFIAEGPDVVISDIRMPVMSGQEMCKSLQELGKGKPFLIIIITSTAEQSDRLWVDEIDNANLVEKPVSPSHLLAVVEDYLNKAVV